MCSDVYRRAACGTGDPRKWMLPLDGGAPAIAPSGLCESAGDFVSREIFSMTSQNQLTLAEQRLATS
jgi:hypothetical protein